MAEQVLFQHRDLNHLPFDDGVFDDVHDFILNVPDYYAFITYSLFCGKVPR